MLHQEWLFRAFSKERAFTYISAPLKARKSTKPSIFEYKIALRWVIFLIVGFKESVK
jgi:hypothetical protein